MFINLPIDSTARQLSCQLLSIAHTPRVAVPNHHLHNTVICHVKGKCGTKLNLKLVKNSSS